MAIIALDVSVLSGYYDAQLQLRTASSVPAQQRTNTASRGPAVETPWGTDDSEKSINRRYSEVRNKTNFIELNSDAVKEAGTDRDAKALFALYESLSSLQTLAEYAAQDSTPDNLLKGLNDQFKSGLGQVEDYVQDVELDKLTLMFGEKTSRAETDVGLGKTAREQTYQTIHVGDKSKPMTGVTGTEVFTINLSLSGSGDDVVVDLSQIEGDVTIDKLNTLINNKINEVTKLDGEGNPVPKYGTKFEVVEVEDNRYALKATIGVGEELTFSAAVAEPVLYVTGTHQDRGAGTIETSTLTRLTGLNDTNAAQDSVQSIAGTRDGYVEVEPDKDAAEDAEVKFEKAKLDAATSSQAVAVDSQGFVYVLGNSQGDFDRQINTAETSDVFLTKYDASGNLIWNRLLGASDTAEGFDIAIDGEDNVVIAGHVNSEIESSDLFSGQDSFVAKYSGQGTQLWVQQLDSVGADQANAVTVDANGDIYVVGQAKGAVTESATSFGGQDSYVVKLTGTDGTVAASQQFGTSGTEISKGVAIASDGNILVASEEAGNAVVRKLDANDLSSTLWSVDLGSLGGGSISDLAVDGNRIYVGGITSVSSLSGGGTTVNAASGGNDGFITAIDDNGGTASADWTHFLGSTAADSIEGLTAQNGSVYVAGTTKGSLPGDALSGDSNGFAAKIDGTTGSTNWIQQFGGVEGSNGASGVAFSDKGSSILTTLGLPTGTVNYQEDRRIVDQTTARAGDYFYVQIDGRSPVKVTIREDDTYATLAKRIDRLSLSKLDATQTSGSNGPTLKIEAKGDAEIRIIAGSGSQDALAKIGMEPITILSTDKVFKLNAAAEGTDPNDLGGVYGLNLDSNYSLSSKKEAEFVANQLANTLSNIERAYRSLTYDPAKAQLLKESEASSGTVPAYYNERLSNYQAGLSRLQSGGGLII